MIHLVFIASARDVDRILSGEKSCESRLFRRNSHPAKNCSIDDELVFRSRHRGGVFAKARVARVDAYHSLSRAGVQILQEKYTRCVDGKFPDHRYWSAKMGAKNAIFVHFDSVEPLSMSPTTNDLLPFSPWGWVPDVSRELFAFI